MPNDGDRFTWPLNWLQDDLALLQKTIENGNPMVILFVEQFVTHWQKDSDLASLRETEQVAKLTLAEQKVCNKLWPEAKKFEQQVRSRYTMGKLEGTLTGEKSEQIHPWNMMAGRTYLLEMESKQFDTILLLQDGNGKTLAKNDDINYQEKNLNSRLVFRPKQDEVYRLAATSYLGRGSGDYALPVNCFLARTQLPLPPQLFWLVLAAEMKAIRLRVRNSRHEPRGEQE